MVAGIAISTAALVLASTASIHNILAIATTITVTTAVISRDCYDTPWLTLREVWVCD